MGRARFQALDLPGKILPHDRPAPGAVRLRLLGLVVSLDRVGNLASRLRFPRACRRRPCARQAPDPKARPGARNLSGSQPVPRRPGCAHGRRFFSAIARNQDVRHVTVNLMVRPFHLALLLPALAVLPMRGQNAPTPLTAPAAASVAPADGAASEPSIAPAALKRSEDATRSARAISPEVAAQLAASRPKFSPTPLPKPEEDLPDLREIDKPKN